ncbi:hypothetical protein NKH36_17940 [Mesorhizobium sp. M1312]|uniref:hypothetical protein n=1 Tax=unclassified Mesorhizobium TaxID=325217 RepID=UPI00333BAE3F
MDSEDVVHKGLKKYADWNLGDSSLFPLFARLCWPVVSAALLDRIAEQPEKP